MSFSFGSPTTTSGSTFGTATPSTGFAFGSGDTAKQGLFGTNTAETKPAFNFSSPSGGGFAFGAAKTTAPTSSLFSTPATTGAVSAFGASKPLSFGGFASPPNQTVGSPGFGQPAAQNAAQNLSFGGINQQQQQQQQQPASAFGSPPTQASTGFGVSPGSGFGFGKPPASTTGFGFATPASGFSAAPGSTANAPQTTQSTVPQTTQSFLGSAQAPTALGFGQSAFGAKPGSAFSFGGGGAAQAPAFGSPTTSAGAVPSPTSGFGVPGQKQPTPQTGLSFGTTAQPTGLNTGQVTGLSTGLSFGGAQPAAASTTPAFGTMTSSFQAPSGLSFGSPASGTPGAPAAGLGFGTTPPASQPQTGMSFGSAPASTAQPTTGLSIGTAAATTSQPPAPGYGSTGLVHSGPATTGMHLASSTASQPTSGLNFGVTSAAPTGLSFGTATSAPTGPSFGAPASSAPSGLSFGAPASSAPSVLSFGAPASSAPTGLSFGAPASSAQITKPTAVAGSTTLATASTGSSFGTTSAPKVGLTFGTSTATTQPTGISFGAVSTAASTTQQPGFGFTGTSTSTGLGFGKPITSAAASSAASTTAPSGITALAKTTAATTMATLTTATTTTPSAPPQIISTISFAQLEESINKWTLELEEQEKTFINQATQINAWDRLLIANGEKIVELNDAVQSVKNEQQSLEHELDFVLAQQNELEDLLAPMEKQLLDETVDRLRDPEREHMYTLAENLDTQLRQMSEDLKEVIEHLNETNRSQDSNDPIVQIGRILNAHMSSMQWIDNSIAQISTKLDQLKATHDTLRRDNERSFQLTYN